MARPRSGHVENLKRELLVRLRQPFERPGARFFSARVIAGRFDVSYQTADRLLRELAADGLLVRRAASGTYVPGRPSGYEGAELIFNPRARHQQSFGAHLLEILRVDLERAGIRWCMRSGSRQNMHTDKTWFPVIWESSEALAACVKAQRAALIINDAAPAGLGSLYIDSVAMDDFGGGAMAADLLVRQVGTRARLAVFSGPESDHRSRERVRGFLARASATVTPAPDWHVEGGLKVVGRILRNRPQGVFCCNDRLAEAVVIWCQRKHMVCPWLVGFDDAPVAARLGLTTIAIPWSQLARAVITLVQRRVGQDVGPGTRQVLMPHPVVRWSVD
jgi:DNA-binding transcriptional regulator YhcF (GntR family)